MYLNWSTERSEEFSWLKLKVRERPVFKGADDALKASFINGIQWKLEVKNKSRPKGPSIWHQSCCCSTVKRACHGCQNDSVMKCIVEQNTHLVRDGKEIVVIHIWACKVEEMMQCTAHFTLCKYQNNIGIGIVQNKRWISVTIFISLLRDLMRDFQKQLELH